MDLHPSGCVIVGDIGRLSVEPPTLSAAVLRRKVLFRERRHRGGMLFVSSHCDLCEGSFSDTDIVEVEVGRVKTTEVEVRMQWDEMIVVCAGTRRGGEKDVRAII